jgi:hypothetical protein
VAKHRNTNAMQKALRRLEHSMAGNAIARRLNVWTQKDSGKKDAPTTVFLRPRARTPGVFFWGGAGFGPGVISGCWAARGRHCRSAACGAFAPCPVSHAYHACAHPCAHNPTSMHCR